MTHPMVERAAKALARNEVSGSYVKHGGIYRTDARAALQAAFELTSEEVITLAYQAGIGVADTTGLLRELRHRSLANVSATVRSEESKTP